MHAPLPAGVIFSFLEPSPLQISNAPTPAIRTQRSFSRTFAAPLDVGCALDEVVLAVVEAEFATIDVELGTKDERGSGGSCP